MVFALNLAPVQLARKGGDVHFWSIAPWREEMGFDIQILFGVNNIPHVEMGYHYFYRLVFVPYVVLLKFLDVLRVDGSNDGSEFL